MPYRYETHLHTCEASACGITRGRDYIPFFQDQGYHGIIVTDHFFGGNTAVNRKLPWRSWVDQFCLGYEAAKNEGDRRGFQVLFGWEQNYDGDEYLVYGLDKAWLGEHPEITRWTRAQQYEQVRRSGGCVVQAHPFRSRSYLSRIYLNTACVDGVEVYNGANRLYENAQAYRYAQSLGKTMMAGTDIHLADSDGLSGIVLDTSLADERDLARRIREHEPIGLIAPVEKLKTARLEPVTLPAEVLGEGGAPVQIPLSSLLTGEPR
ncbi:MAG: histidinol-phosphatase [Clostridiales bacterium]|nr:histidinol-phosphatase [Clostridiales bacterium]